MTDFDQFWAHYPRRVAKGAARVAWMRAEKREPELLAKCLAALAWQVRTNEWDGGSYTPHPATYLNQERYDDERPALVENEAPEVTQARRARVEAETAERFARERAQFGERRQA